MRKRLKGGVLLVLSVMAFTACTGGGGSDGEDAPAPQLFSVNGKNYSTLQEAVDEVAGNGASKAFDITNTIKLLDDTKGNGATVRNYEGEIKIDFGSFTYIIDGGTTGIDFGNAKAEITAENKGGLKAEISAPVVQAGSNGTITIPSDYKGVFSGTIKVESGSTLKVGFNDSADVTLGLEIPEGAHTTLETEAAITYTSFNVSATITIPAGITPIVVTRETTLADVIGKKMEDDNKDKGIRVTKVNGSYKPLLTKGILAMERGQYDEGVDFFQQAYEANPNDETRVYSALASLASISTKQAMQDFMRDHLRVLNYPGTMNALFDEGWREVISYPNEEYRMSGYRTVAKADDTGSGNTLYYRASENAGGIGVNPMNVYRQGTTNRGDTFYARLVDWEEYKENTTGQHVYAGAYRFVLDDNGEYYVPKYNFNSTGHQAYVLQGREKYTYGGNYTPGPAYDIPEWVTSTISPATYGFFLPLLIEGNTAGLNDALDDLYGILFGEEYEDACRKIDAIQSTVEVPQRVIKDFGLEKYVGEDSGVSLGPAELKLVETSFNILKAVIEYAQGYNLNHDLSFMKFDMFDDAKTKAQYDTYLEKGYVPSLDPLKCGFMDVRSRAKIDSAKASLAKAVGQLISAYDDIVSNNAKYHYPTVMVDKLQEYNYLKVGAKRLKTSISKGQKFYIPEYIENRTPWPTSGDLWIDFGAVFTPENFALQNFVTMGKDGKPEFFLIDIEDHTKTTYTIRQYLDFLKDSSDLAEHITPAIRINMNPVAKAVSEKLWEGKSYYLPFDEQVGLLLYNFYHDGDITSDVKAIENARRWFQ